MNHKPLFIASMIVTLLAASGLDGGALSVGQALALILLAGVLMVWSFRQTEWYEPAEKCGEEDADTSQPI